jgi:hypothetical protein
MSHQVDRPSADAVEENPPAGELDPTKPGRQEQTGRVVAPWPLIGSGHRTPEMPGKSAGVVPTPIRVERCSEIVLRF